MKLARRFFVYLLGLFILAFGVSVSVKSSLGVSPVNSVPYVISLAFNLDQGMMTTIIFSLFVLFQIAILRKNFKAHNLLQVLYASFFGVFITITNRILWFPTPNSYLLQLVLLLISILIISFGLVLYLKAEILPMPPEGFVMTLRGLLGMEFHKLKVIFDISLITLSIAIALSQTGTLSGVREGTILSAFLIGRTMGIYEKLFKSHFQKLDLFLGKIGDIPVK